MDVFTKSYWNAWLEKFFSFFVSVKMIVIMSSTGLAVGFYFLMQHLLIVGKVNGEQFTKLVETDLKYWSVVMGVIIGARGAIQIAELVKKPMLDKINEKLKEVEE